MSRHDPLCYQFVEHVNMPSYCFCELIEAVRRDERTKARIRAQEAISELESILEDK